MHPAQAWQAYLLQQASDTRRDYLVTPSSPRECAVGTVWCMGCVRHTCAGAAGQQRHPSHREPAQAEAQGRRSLATEVDSLYMYST